MVGIKERLDTVYGAAGDRAKLDDAYDDWAASYDQDLWATGNPHIAFMVSLVGRHIIDRSGKILDAGCGTGILGQILHGVGYDGLEGLDASEGMLAVAEKKGCYGRLHRLLLGAEIDLPNESFDAITASGVLTHGHAPPESLDGLLDITRPGAPILFSLSDIAFNDGGFGDKISDIDASGRWEKIEWSRPFRTYPFMDDLAHLRHWICVYRKK